MSVQAATYKVSPEEMAVAIQQLGEFVAIPTVSHPTSPYFNKETMQKGADFASSLLEKLGFAVRQVKIGDSDPFVLAEKVVDAAKPTLLLYAHYDVQPVNEAEWTTDPFVMQERDGRLYGRGASDDKGGIVGIITALGAYLKAYGALPVNVKILFEGEEEYHSRHMAELLHQEEESLRADALVILDGGNVDTETGTLTSSTRGTINLFLEVKSMSIPKHSGVACLAPDPSLALAKLMTALSDPREIPGFMDDCTPLNDKEKEILAQSSQTAEEYAKDHELVPQAKLRGDPEESVYARITQEPSISFLNGGWGQKKGGNSIQASAFTEIGVRLTAGQDPTRITEVLTKHLLGQAVCEDFEVSLKSMGEGSFPWKGDLSQPLSQMYLEALSENFKKMHVQPTGGALPFLRNFKAVFPKMEMLIPGVEDAKCNAHSHNESQDIGLFERAINTLIAFIHKVGKA